MIFFHVFICGWNSLFLFLDVFLSGSDEYLVKEEVLYTQGMDNQNISNSSSAKVKVKISKLLKPMPENSCMESNFNNLVKLSYLKMLFMKYKIIAYINKVCAKK